MIIFCTEMNIITNNQVSSGILNIRIKVLLGEIRVKYPEDYCRRKGEILDYERDDGTDFIFMGN